MDRLTHLCGARRVERVVVCRLRVARRRLNRPLLVVVGVARSERREGGAALVRAQARARAALRLSVGGARVVGGRLGAPVGLRLRLRLRELEVGVVGAVLLLLLRWPRSCVVECRCGQGGRHPRLLAPRSGRRLCARFTCAQFQGWRARSVSWLPVGLPCGLTRKRNRQRLTQFVVDRVELRGL